MVKAMYALKFFCVAVTVLGTTIACGKLPPKDRPNPFVVEGVYDVNAVTLNCANSSRCTNATGIILTIKVTVERDHYYKRTFTSVARCTGTLYSPTQVLTAGHCAESVGTGRTFFKTVASPGKPSRTFEVKRVAKTFYTRSDMYSSDYATLELNSPAEGYDYVRPPTSIPASLNEFTALVVNQPGDDDKSYQVDNVDCESDTDSMPMHVSEFPSVWGTKRCKLVGGNSGGSIYARNNLHEVIGVLSKSTEAKMGGNDTLGRMLRALGGGNTTRPNLATHAHAACFDLPGWPRPAPQCTRITEQSMKEKLVAESKLKSRNAVKGLFRDFQQSRNAVLTEDGVKYKMVPQTALVSKFLLGNFEMRKGIAALPKPFCVLSGQVKQINNRPFKAAVYELDLSTSAFRDTKETVEGTWSLKKKGDLWVATYDLDFVGLSAYSPYSAETVRELTTTGFTASVPVCDGSEDQLMLNLLEQMPIEN